MQRDDLEALKKKIAYLEDQQQGLAKAILTFLNAVYQVILEKTDLTAEEFEEYLEGAQEVMDKASDKVQFDSIMEQFKRRRDEKDNSGE